MVATDAVQMTDAAIGATRDGSRSRWRLSAVSPQEREILTAKASSLLSPLN